MKKKVILIVDDEPAILYILKELFEFEDFQVIQAKSGNAATEIYQENEIDCILSDIKMPDGNGIEMLKEIREVHKSNIPFFLMSGHTDICTETLVKNKVEGIFKKPFDFDSAITKIQSHL